MGVGSGGNIRLSLDSDVLQNHQTVKHCVICVNRKKYYQEKEISIKDIGGTTDNVFKFSCSLNTEIFLTDFFYLLSPLPPLQKLSV